MPTILLIPGPTSAWTNPWTQVVVAVRVSEPESWRTLEPACAPAACAYLWAARTRHSSLSHWMWANWAPRSTWQPVSTVVGSTAVSVAEVESGLQRLPLALRQATAPTAQRCASSMRYGLIGVVQPRRALVTSE